MEGRPHRQTGRQRATAPSQPLPAPTSAIRLDGDDDLIDDTIMAAVDTLPGLPFYVPAYADAAVGDVLTLYVNGATARVKQVTAVTQGEPFELYAVTSLFNFTGRCSVYYVVKDVHANNISVSAPLLLRVARAPYTDPFNGTYPAPIITPDRYAESAFDRGAAVTVMVAYPAMQPSDTISLQFDLYATTQDKPPNYFYTLAQAVPPQPGSAAGAITFTLPSTQFAGIDENIGHVYYSVYTQPLLEAQSKRAQFMVDVVPPYNSMA